MNKKPFLWLKRKFSKPDQDRIFGHKLVMINAAHMMILTAIKSPFIVAIRLGMQIVATEDQKEKNRLIQMASEVPCSTLEVCEALYVFSHSSPETRALLKLPDGRETLGRRAQEIADSLPPMVDMEQIKAALGLHYSYCYVQATENMSLQREILPAGSAN